MNRKGLSQAGEYIVGRRIGFTIQILPVVDIARIDQPQSQIMRPIGSTSFREECEDESDSIK